MFNYNEKQEKEFNSFSNDDKSWGNYSGGDETFGRRTLINGASFTIGSMMKDLLWALSL